MRTDREALIAGIAADPHNDLRKLVFADWLEEHGEPERAEFIRLEIGNRCKETRTDETQQRAATLFTAHWQKWFGPFFSILDPNRGPDGFEIANLVLREFRQREPAGTPQLRASSISAWRGVFSSLSVNLVSDQSYRFVDEALRREPIHDLTVTLVGSDFVWPKLTAPTLDQLTDLAIFGTVPDLAEAVLPDFVSIMSDPHLSGVSELALGVEGSNAAVLVPYFSTFAGSPLANRVRSLQVWGAGSAAVGCLARSERLRLETLIVNDAFSRESGRALASARFAVGLKSLLLEANENETGPITPMFTAICRGKQWKSLTSICVLTSAEQGIRSGGLQTLAKADFLPQLESLTLSLDDQPTLPFIDAIVARLDPARVRDLCFRNCGRIPLPECLTRTFGDRARLFQSSLGISNSWRVRPESLPDS